MDVRASWPGPHIWTRDPFIAFDTETTGLHPEKGDRVVELAMLRVEGLREVDFLSLLLHPGAVALNAFETSGAARVNKIQVQDLLQAPSFEEVAGEVLHFVGDLPLMAYNAPFDVSFLGAELSRLEVPSLPAGLLPGRALDPNVWVRDIDRYVKKRSPTEKRHSLGVTAERWGVRVEGDLHRALSDARILLGVARALAKTRRVQGWTARLLRRQEARRAEQQDDRRRYRDRQKQ